MLLISTPVPFPSDHVYEHCKWLCLNFDLRNSFSKTNPRLFPEKVYHSITGSGAEISGARATNQ